MATDSNVNLNQTIATGQTGLIASSITPQLIKAVVLVPKGTRIPAADMVSQSAFMTYVNGLFQANGPYPNSSQWFCLTPLSDFKNATEKDSVWKTAPYNINVFQYPHCYGFNYLSSVENFVEVTSFNNCQGAKDYFLIDFGGNWHGTLDTSGAGGLQAFNNQQFWVGNREPATDKAGEIYPIMLQLGSALETNGSVKFFQAGYDPSSIPMLQNAIITDVSSVIGSALGAIYTAATDQVIIIKGGQDSQDLVKAYGALIVANLTTLVSTDLNTSGHPTIASATTGLIVVASQPYYYIDVTYSAAPTTTHKVQLAFANPSVVLPLIPALNYVTAIVQPGVNAANAGVKTF